MRSKHSRPVESRVPKVFWIPTYRSTLAARSLAASACLLNASTAATALDFSEPPDLTSSLTQADTVGTLDIGANVIRGSVNGNANAGIGDVGDYFEYTVPQGLVVTRFGLVLSNFSSPAGARARAESFTGGVNSVFIKGNGSFSNRLEGTPRILGPGTYDFLFTATLNDPGSYDWAVTLDVTRGLSIAGVVAGLRSGKSLILQNNLADAITLNANETFNFPTPIITGDSYNVTVLSQPNGQECMVSNGAGTNATADIDDVEVLCLDIDSDGDGTPDDLDDFINASTEEVINGIMLRTTPANASSFCSINSYSVDPFAPPATFSGIGTQVSFSLSGCDARAAETVSVSIDFESPIPPGFSGFKVNAMGELSKIAGAQVHGSTLTYSLIDNGPLDENATLGTIADPVTVAIKLPAPIPTLSRYAIWLLVTMLATLAIRGKGLRSQRR